MTTSPTGRNDQGLRLVQTSQLSSNRSGEESIIRNQGIIHVWKLRIEANSQDLTQLPMFSHFTHKVGFTLDHPEEQKAKNTILKPIKPDLWYMAKRWQPIDP